jgi:peptide chain release factor 1
MLLSIYLSMIRLNVRSFFNRGTFVQQILLRHSSKSLAPFYQPLVESIESINKSLNQKQTLYRDLKDFTTRCNSLQERQEWTSLITAEVAGLDRSIDADWKSVESFLYGRLLSAGYLADDVLDCRLEIKAGAGGQEAAAFAGELFDAYELYVSKRAFTFEKVSTNLAIVRKSQYAEPEIGPYGVFRLEHGIHRMQRFPVVVQTQDKPQTIAVSVAVAPVRMTKNVDVKPADLAIIQQRSCAGAGGQGLMAATQAIRMKHIPSGIEVFVTESRSHIDNRKIALEKIKEKVAERIAGQKQTELNAYLKSAYGSGAWAEKIRSYNVLRDDVTDHRIDFKIFGVSAVLEAGGFDIFTDRLRAEETSRVVDEFVSKEFGVND